MVRGQEVFLATHQLFVQFLTWPEPHDIDADVLALHQSGQSDHPAREVCNAHALSHVEDEDVVSGAGGGSLHHQLNRLWNGHEEPGHIGVRQSDGAAGLDLPAEEGDDASVVEDVAEPGDDALPAPSPMLRTTSSAIRLEAPMTLVGLTALSVLTRTKVWTPALWEARRTRRCP